MSSIQQYINRLIAQRGVHETAIKDIDLKIQVAREIEAEVEPKTPRHEALELADVPTTSTPLRGMKATRAVARYMELYPSLEQIQPYTLHKNLEMLGFYLDSKNIRQIVSRTFINWAKAHGWYKADKGIWRRSATSTATNGHISMKPKEPALI